MNRERVSMDFACCILPKQKTVGWERGNVVGGLVHSEYACVTKPYNCTVIHQSMK